MYRRSFLTAPVAAACVLPLASLAQPGPAVRAERPWARATAPRQTVGGAYMTLISQAEDRLIGVSSPAAGHAEVHETQMEGAVMRMRELPDGLALPAETPVTLAPGGYHIMLVDLAEPLVAGQTLLLDLRFQHAAPLRVEVPVAAVGAQGPH